MTAIAKSAKRHPAAKKCCGWEEPAICNSLVITETFVGNTKGDYSYRILLM